MSLPFLHVFINVSVYIFMPINIYVFHKYLFKSYYIPGSDDPEFNKTDKVPVPMEYTI